MHELPYYEWTMSQLRKWGVGFGVLTPIVVLLAATLLVGCSNDSSRDLASASKAPSTLETVAAQKFLSELKESGHLPGFTTNDHGRMTSDYVPLAKNVLYPFSITYHCVKNGDSSTYHYTVVSESKDSAWQLQRAWKTDSNGKVLEEWPVQ